jgi:hypothetical protein
MYPPFRRSWKPLFCRGYREHDAGPGGGRRTHGLSASPYSFKMGVFRLSRMSTKSHENLRSIRFEGELLPAWAQLLDVATRLCPLPEDVRHWFSRFTSGAGVEDARAVLDRCVLLRSGIMEHRQAIMVDLGRIAGDSRPSQILGAWLYALDTMIQVAQSSSTCSWEIEGAPDNGIDDADGEGTLRRV